MERKRTKIICTIGPASNSVEVIQALIESGMDIARVNFSHGSHQDHAETIDRLRAASRALGTTLSILQDLSGPKMRIGKFTTSSIHLRPNSKFTLTARQTDGDENGVSINCPALIQDLNAGDSILLADGELELRVISTTGTDVTCEVVLGGELQGNKGISVPGVLLSQSIPTPKDIEDLRFGIRHGVDWVAQSFVRTANELRRLMTIIQENGSDVPIIAKIEKREALDELDQIIAEADGIMVARGDLGLEIPFQDVPLVQKEIIRKANLAGKPVVTATQMLESMIHHPRPTRAEATDIANAIFDGTDAIMLSGETAIGKYPIDAVRTMADVALATEEKIDFVERFKRQPIECGGEIPDAIAHAACHTALEVDAEVVICCTRSGQTARLVAKHRPHALNAVVSANEETLRRTMLFWGTYAVRIQFAQNTDQLIEMAKAAVLKSGIALQGDRAVIVAGIPTDVPGPTNMIKVDVL